MAASRPLVDLHTGRIDKSKILLEALPIAELIGLVVAAALVPFALAIGLGSYSRLGLVLMLVAQVILAIGGGVVLLYIVTRANQLAAD